MKIVLAGAGKVGLAITKQLVAEGHEITMVDHNRRVTDSVSERFDVATSNGNCASMETLTSVGVQKADILIAMTGADEVNLLTCLTAHELNPSLHTLARVRNPQYTQQIFRMRDVFGLSMVINPERSAASEIERLLQFPGTLKRDTFAKGRVEIVELRVQPGGKLDGTVLSSINDLVHAKVLVCSVLRGGEAIIPNGGFRLEAGDRVFITAPTVNLMEMLQRLGLVKRRVRRVLLCGGSGITFYLAQQLIKNGMDVTIIELDHDRCRELVEQLPGAVVVHGDASDISLLESEDIAKYDAVAAMTGMDEVNIVISLYAKNMGVEQVVTKVGHIANTNLLENLPLDCVISPKELSCNSIVRYVRALENQVGAARAVHSIAEGRSEAMEFRVDENTWKCGVPLRALRLKVGVLIVCIMRGPQVEIADGNSYYEKGDTVIVVSNRENVINTFNDIFA